MPSLTAWAPYKLSVLRIVTGLLFFSEGMAKFFNIPPVPMFAHLPPILVFQGIVELAGGALMLLGLFSRPTAFILSGDMAFAYFWAHAPRSFYPALNGGMAAILFCFVFLYFVFAGPGPWSLDHKLRRGTV